MTNDIKGWLEILLFFFAAAYYLRWQTRDFKQETHRVRLLRLAPIALLTLSIAGFYTSVHIDAIWLFWISVGVGLTAAIGMIIGFRKPERSRLR